MRATGVDIVDQLLGGLAPGLPLLIAGETGSGRNEICLELGMAAVRRGERVAYLTTQMPEGLARQTALLGFDLPNAVREERIAVLQLDADVGSKLRAHGAEALMEALAEEAPLAEWIIFEALGSLVEEILDAVPLRAAVECLMCGEFSHSRQFVGCVDVDAMYHRPVLARALADVAGAFIELRRGEEGRRTASVIKSQTGTASPGRVTFDVVQGRAEVLAAERTSPLLPQPVEEKVVPSPVAEPVPPPVAEVEPEAPAERAHVLVIDEDTAARDQICAWLEAEYEVFATSDGFDALSQIVAEPPDAIVLELVLPRVSGYELLGALRRARVHAPALVLSGRLMRAADRIRPLVLGAADVMTKPPTRVELMHRVDSLLRARPAEEAPLVPAEPLGFFLESAHRIVDEAEFRDRVVRTLEVGEAYGVTSSLVGFEIDDAATFEALVQAAEAVLRAEDALLPFDDARGLLLLVAADPSGCAIVARRIAAEAEKSEVRWLRATLVAPGLPDDLEKCFAELEPLDVGVGR